MTFRRFSAVSIFIMAASLAMVSCKDEEETPVSPSLDGTLRFSVPQYVDVDETLSMTATGVTHPEGDDHKLGVYWKISPDMEINDTSDVAFDPEKGASMTYKLKGKIQSYTITCGVFASGYSSSIVTRSTTAVKGGMDGTGSITEAGISASDRTFVDSRDGKVYYITTIGDKVWFRHNLAYGGEITAAGKSLGHGIPYLDCEAMTDVFGLYYTQEQAVNACPDGWRIPSENDWLDMANSVAWADKDLSGKTFMKGQDFSGLAGALMADALFNGNELWEYWPQVKITNSSGLSALSAGYAIIADGANKFDGSTEYAAFWTSEKDSEKGSYRYIRDDSADVYIGTGYGSFAASARCVRDL
ncbi:MAG: hypothetical protein NC115_02695 [Bacteroidales bacterium]|nr:hypothetical protein [Bacteroidales bacterium]